MVYAYAVEFHKDENGTMIATVPDVPGTMTVGADRTQALERVQGALLVMLAARIQDHESIPHPSKTMKEPPRGQRLAILPPLAAAKLSVYEAMRARRITPAALAGRLGWQPARVQRLLDLRRRSRLEHIETALAALGKRLVIEVASAA